MEREMLHEWTGIIHMQQVDALQCVGLGDQRMQELKTNRML